MASLNVRLSRVRLLSSVGLLAVTIAATGQASPPFGGKRIPTDRPEPASSAFEGFNIRPSNPSGGDLGFEEDSNGRITVGHATVHMLMSYAYDIEEARITGGPTWASTERNDIEAHSRFPPTTEGATPTPAEREMLQGLLASKYGLRCHRVIIRKQVWLLTKGKGALALQPAKDSKASPAAAVFGRGDIFDGEAVGRNVSMRFLAQQLSPDLGHPVVDHTSLSGSYDFHVLPFAPSNHKASLAVEGAMARLGLHIEPGVAPVEVMAIDSLSHPTLSSNLSTPFRAETGPFDSARNPSKDLLAAQKQAGLENKNILLDVGGNWCGSCLLLDRSMRDEAELHARLDHFIVLHVNYSPQNTNKHFFRRYPQPKSFPFWYVLSPNGRQLAAQSPQASEGTDDAYDRLKISEFLDHWKAPSP